MLPDKITDLFPKSKDGKVLVSNFGYLTILQFASYIFPLITIPYLAKTIGTEGFGKIAFASAIITWIQTITDWGFIQTATRDVAKNRDNKTEVSRIFSETFWARCLLMVVSFICLAILTVTIPTFRKNTAIIYATFLMIPGHIMFPDWFFQAIERMRYTTITNLTVKIVFTVAVFLFIKEREDYILQPIFTSLGYFAAGIIAMFLILHRWGYNLHVVSVKAVIKAIRRSTDVFVNSMFPNLYNSLSVVLLGIFGGSVANGLYSEGNKFATICQNFLNVLSRVFFPLLSRRKDKHAFFVKLYVGTTLVASLILFTCAPWIIQWFYTEEFYNAIPVLRIMSISLVFLSLNQAYGLNYMIAQGHERILRRITMYCSLFGFVLAYPLIYHYSYIGVALTVTLSRMSLGILSWIAVRKIKYKEASNP